MARHAAHVADAVTSNAKGRLDIKAVEGRVTVNGRTRVTFLVARQAKERMPGHARFWRVYRRQKQSGLLAILRLDEANRAIADHVLIPATQFTKNYLRFSNQAALPAGTHRFETLVEVTRVLEHC